MELYVIFLVICGVMDGMFIFNIFGGDYDMLDGICVCDYVYVSDFGEVYVLVLKYLFDGGVSEILNFGIGYGFSVM